MIHTIFILFILLVTGCSREVTQTEVLGRYEFAIENVKQQITIEAGGKYSNAFYRDDALVWSESGQWEYYKEMKGYKGIILDKFRFGFQEYASGGTWFVEPEKTLIGSKKLCFDPDLDRCFLAK